MMYELKTDQISSSDSLTRECLPSDLLTLGSTHVDLPTLSDTITSVFHFCATICSDSLMNSSMQKSCHVACAHIVCKRPIQFVDLAGVYCLKRVINALGHVVEANRCLDDCNDAGDLCGKRKAIAQLAEWLLLWGDLMGNAIQGESRTPGKPSVTIQPANNRQ